jgi:hypothetical protein
MHSAYDFESDGAVALVEVASITVELRNILTVWISQSGAAKLPLAFDA